VATEVVSDLAVTSKAELPPSQEHTAARNELQPGAAAKENSTPADDVNNKIVTKGQYTIVLIVVVIFTVI